MQKGDSFYFPGNRDNNNNNNNNNNKKAIRIKYADELPWICKWIFIAQLESSKDSPGRAGGWMEGWERVGGRVGGREGEPIGNGIQVKESNGGISWVGYANERGAPAQWRHLPAAAISPTNPSVTKRKSQSKPKQNNNNKKPQKTASRKTPSKRNSSILNWITLELFPVKSFKGKPNETKTKSQWKGRKNGGKKKTWKTHYKWNMQIGCV